MDLFCDTVFPTIENMVAPAELTRATKLSFKGTTSVLTKMQLSSNFAWSPARQKDGCGNHRHHRCPIPTTWTLLYSHPCRIPMGIYCSKVKITRPNLIESGRRCNKFGKTCVLVLLQVVSSTQTACGMVIKHRGNKRFLQSSDFHQNTRNVSEKQVEVLFQFISSYYFTFHSLYYHGNHYFYVKADIGTKPLKKTEEEDFSLPQKKTFGLVNANSASSQRRGSVRIMGMTSYRTLVVLSS